MDVNEYKKLQPMQCFVAQVIILNASNASDSISVQLLTSNFNFINFSAKPSYIISMIFAGIIYIAAAD